MNTLFAIFELLGTIAFAISGAMEGIRHKMDLFGVAMLGLVTSIGGGVLRDVVIGDTPPRVFRNPNCAILAIIVSVVVFIVLRCSRAKEIRFAREREIFYNLSDTLGLGVFTVLGIETVGAGNVGLLLFVGMISGVGGGVLRDVLAGTVPSIFRKHIYALASAAGAIVDILLMRFASHEIAMVAGFGTVVLIRLLAAHYKWNLPHIEL